MSVNQMRDRSKQFALRIIRLVTALPRSLAGDVVGRQILKSGTSIGANYREAHRASSRKQFISSMQIVLREADETMYWLELLRDGNILKATRLGPIIGECNELVAIFASTVKTAKKNAAAEKKTEKLQRSPRKM